jgi:hypothetical protein
LAVAVAVFVSAVSKSAHALLAVVSAPVAGVTAVIRGVVESVLPPGIAVGVLYRYVFAAPPDW